MIRVYGPYTRVDGRKHVIHYDDTTKKKRTQSYPRYIMEQYLGRELESWEQVDHINDDFTDDRIENLQILTQKENITKSAKSAEMLEFVCPICGTELSRPAKDYRYHQVKKGKSGPYCSKSCTGTAHH